MNFFSDIFNSITGKNTNEVEENEYNTNNVVSNTIPKLVGPNESCIIRKFNPNFLEQGKTLHREQSKRSDYLRSNIRSINESMNNGYINNNIEGFGDMTASKNSSDLSETTTLSNSFDKNIERYNKEYPLFIDETRNAAKLNDRNKNMKDNSSLFTNSDNNFYDITYQKEGCYKSAGASGLELQTDLNDVSVQTCKMRASDLGYSGFAMSRGRDGQLSCYLSKDISTAKTGGISTKPMTSLAFKTSTSANMGGLLFNGQLGIYNNSIDNNLVTDLEGVKDCDIKGGDILINDKSVVATWGGNCKEPQLKIIENSEWELIGRDKNTGGVPDASFWAVKSKNDGKHDYYPMGNTIYAGSAGTVYDNPPNSSGYLIAGDVKDPLSYFTMAGPGGKDDITIKRPMCPSGYSSMGDVVIDADDYPTPKNIKCIPTDCITTDTSQGNTIWRGLGIELKKQNYNLFKGNRGDYSTTSIKDSCLKIGSGNVNSMGSAAPSPAPTPTPEPSNAPAAKNKIAIDLINTVFNYLDQILISVKNITSARNQNANNSGLVSFNYITLAKKQLTEAISAINSNNYTQATANINSSLPNIANGTAFCLMAFAIINANQATKDYVNGLGTNAKKNLESAINALA